MESAKQCCSLTETLHHEFFKVFMPDTSSTHLRLPKAFTKFFNGITPMKAILVDQVGKSWDIELEKIKDGLVLTNGWQQFVSDKCLVEAEFLVFGYDGNSTFYVKIFSKNGVRKEEPAIVMLDEEDSYEQSCRKIILGEGSHQGKSERSAQAHNEKKAHGSLAKRVPLKNPHFVISISRSRMKSVEVPKLVLREWNIRLKSEINVRDENDQVWPVKIVTTTFKARQFFSAGWSNFRKAKNIKEGHLCAFKFVTGKDNNVAQEVLVRVLPPSIW